MTKKKLDASLAESEVENTASCCFLPALQAALRGGHFTLTSDDLAMLVLRELARTNASFRSHDENDKGITMGLVEARREVNDGLRRLSKLGFGRFVVGRRGSPTRLQLTMDGREALRAHWQIEDEPQATPQPTITKTNNDAATISHQFVLRPEFVVRLTLPTDLSTNEAGRLARFLESLPFVEATTQSR